jgi:putative PIN family toxin of toxin-antitoxin system
MQNIVLDTNIIVSAAISPKGNPAQIINMIAYDEDLQVYYSADILAEYTDVLTRKRLNIAREIQLLIINTITEIGILIEPTISDILMLDESDRVFYDTAKESDSILITGNAKHYPKEDFIMTPSQFLSRLR